MHEALCPQRICNLSLISSLGLFIVTFPKQTTRQLKHGLRQRGLGTLYWFRAAGRTPAWGTEEPPSFSLLNSVGFLQSPVSASRIHATPTPPPLRGGHFATQKLQFPNINLLPMPTFLTHRLDKVWDFLSVLRLKLQNLLLILNLIPGYK